MTEPHDMTETDAAIEAAVAKYGPGDPIGRWGPVQAHRGRTVGEPCLALFAMCDDYDVDAWLTETKWWVKAAKQLREELIVPRWGAAPAEWPQTARNAERAYERAREVLAGELGFLDGARVVTLQSAQRYAKVALELFTRAIEADLNTTVDVDHTSLGHDTIADPEDVPPVIPQPPLPTLPPIGLYLKIGAGALVGIFALKIVSSVWKK